MPTPEELELIRDFTGNPHKMGKPEQFMIAVSACEAAVSRVQAHLLRAKFPENYELFTPDLVRARP